MHLNPGRWPIAWRITGALIVLTVASVITVTAFGLRRGREALHNVTIESIERIAQMTADRLDKLVRKTRSDCLALSRNEALIDACSFADESSRTAAERQLRVTCESDLDLSWAVLASTDGTILAANDTIPESFDIRQRVYFQEAVKGSRYISGMLTGRITGDPGVFFSFPVRPRAGEPQRVLGVVMLKLNGRRVQELIEGVGIEDKGYAMLTEVVAPKCAVVIAHPDPTRLFSSNLALTPEQIRKIDPQRRWNRPTVPVHAARLLSGGADASSFAAEVDGEVSFGAVAHLKEIPWRIIAVQPESEFLAPFKSIRKWQAITVLAVLAFACLLAFLQSRSILRPVRQLTEAAEQIAQGNLDARANIESDDELGRLARVFDDMVPQLRANLKLQQSLALAADVQAELLPSQAPSFPGLDVAGTSVSYEQIGGDYYDFIDLDPSFGVALGDIMGHGIAAAMLMATARAHVRSGVMPLPELGDLFNGVNARLADDLGDEKFMTLAFYVLTPEQGRVDWISAGQDPAFHFRAATGEIEEVVNKNVPIGVIADWEYKATSRDDLAAGDVLLLGTDGIWEMRNHEREEFGKERVRDLLRTHHASSAQEIMDAVIVALKDYSGDLPPQDDVTLVVIRIL